MGASINGHVVHEKSILWLIGSCLKRLHFSTVFDCDKDVVTWDFKDHLSYFIYVMCTFLDLAGILDVIQPLVVRGKMFPNWQVPVCR